MFWCLDGDGDAMISVAGRYGHYDLYSAQDWASEVFDKWMSLQRQVMFCTGTFRSIFFFIFFLPCVELIP